MTYAGAVAASSAAITKIAGSTLASTAASFDFTSIPQTYNSLLVVVAGIGNSGNAYDLLRLRFNNSSTGYDSLTSAMPSNQGGSLTTTGVTSTTYMNMGVVGNGSRVGQSRIHIMGYTNAVNWHSATAESGWMGSGSSNWLSMMHAGIWSGTAAITQVTVLPAAGSFTAGSSAALYGLS